MSVACLRVAQDHGLRADLVMGHSLGEFSALVACGSIGFDQAVRLVGERGAAMQAAGEARPGTMAAILGLSDEEATALCTESGDVWPANFNCPGQVVASGTRDGIERLLVIAAERGIKHICWDGCMFDNAVLEAAATWNAILKAMIEVDQAL
jgi:malonyl CoA-acyl carrier protein transacylase